MANPLAEAATKLVEVLSPLASDERLRVVDAALTLLGDARAPAATATNQKVPKAATDQSDSGAFSPQVQAWVNKSKLELSQLENFFHFDNGQVTPIALPGSSKKKVDQAVACYLTAGLAAFLQSGDSAFTDEQARKLCEHFGCYDVGNHSKNVKALGNKITGTKSTGWKLTQPGLSAFAELAKGSSTS